jgi:hypothetical protein
MLFLQFDKTPFLGVHQNGSRPVVQFSLTLGLVAYGEIAHMAGREELVTDAQAKMESGASSVL